MDTRSSKILDEIDAEIIKILQEDCRLSLEYIANKLKVPKSTIHYRIRRLEEEGIIEGYHAKINFEKLGKDFLTITLVRAKYEQGYHEKIGHKICTIPGVWGVYFVFGENDFIVLTRSKNREDYLRKLEIIMGMPEIERTNTLIVAKVVKEDLREDLNF
ncbi:MAG: Lrp/AsnC family transcriptional regulator [Candidatus Bathyarchaeia archaeon]|jgi:DNA-binding Lrp family transcriptional regulator